MARNWAEHPTQLELEILNIIWRDGPATVRHVRNALESTRDLAFTTVHTKMNVMVKKGFLAAERRGKGDGGTLYKARVARRKTGRQLLRALLAPLFGGSVTQAMQALMTGNGVDEEELRKLQLIVAKANKRRRK